MIILLHIITSQNNCFRVEYANTILQFILKKRTIMKSLQQFYYEKYYPNFKKIASAVYKLVLDKPKLSLNANYISVLRFNPILTHQCSMRLDTSL